MKHQKEKHLVPSKEELFLKAEKLRLLEQKLAIADGLPHLFGLKLYKWQREYKENRFNKKRFICAANQIGKSSIQIMERIDIATRPEIWKDLYPEAFKINKNTRPYSWYLYPNQDTCLTEFYEKWVPMYMPRGAYKDHPVYGWKEHIVNKVLKYVEFNSGWKIYFKTYNQNIQDLQSGTVFAIDFDEELPEQLLSELQARLFATDGYLSGVFTATLGQEFWRKVIEGREAEETWADAWKRQISMFDCVEYEDGTPSRWSPQRIQGIIANCKSKSEVLRRVYGRFVVSDGLKYTGFTREKNLKPYPKTASGKYYKGVPNGWMVYSGVDLGSGGKDNHPAAYSFIAVSPDMTKIRWFKGRRLDKIETTDGDTYKYYSESRGNIQPVCQSYDFASKDFGIIVQRLGEPWNKAEKNHESGESILNTAFKTGMLVIYYDPTDPEDEGLKLVNELESLSNGKDKRICRDDFIDSLRYAIMPVPIDWEALLNGEEVKYVDKSKIDGGRGERGSRQDREDREEEQLNNEVFSQSIDSELQEWGELY